MRRVLISFRAVCCFALIAAAPAFAQNPLQPPLLYNPNAPAPDINSVPGLANMVKSGAKLFYLGERSGLFGWFIIKDGQVQMIYVTPDKKTAIIGGMFTSEGENVSGQQITHLTQANKEVSDLVNASAKQQEEVLKAGAASGGFASVAGGTSSGQGLAVQGGVPGVKLSPGDRLLQDMRAAAGVTLGKSDNAEIIIVISPNCPYCKATWKELRESVLSNRAQVRLVPVSGQGGDDTRAAAQLLRASNPLETWEKFVGGDKSALAGEADSALLQAVSLNNLLIEKWNIQSTPYLVYRAKDGRVKIVQGKPEHMGSVLADLLR